MTRDFTHDKADKQTKEQARRSGLEVALAFQACPIRQKAAASTIGIAAALACEGGLPQHGLQGPWILSGELLIVLASVKASRQTELSAM
jgi:hypothetical protein